MAYSLKSGVTITDECGNEYISGFAVINQCNGNKREKIQHFVLEVYKSEAKFLDGKSPILQYQKDVSGSEFEEWFSVTAIHQGGGDQYAQAYRYLNQSTDELGNMIRDDWENYIRPQ